MNGKSNVPWDHFKKRYWWFESIGLGLDLSRTSMPLDYEQKMSTKIQSALDEMEQLEAGAIANKDENRMVGHYWLRNPDLAPTNEIAQQIRATIHRVKQFASDVHSGRIHGTGGTFTDSVVIGIGGSALGPQFVSHALGHPRTDRIQMHFLDNTDPDGFERLIAKLDGKLARTLCIVISKSGGTKETRNGMLEVAAAYKQVGFDFANHAVAVTGEGSELDGVARAQGWVTTFPMWDWVGGRTSELSAVGLLSAALQGIDVDAFLDGAAKCDQITEPSCKSNNPALLIALLWFYIGNGRGEKSMIVLPYKDRLELFSRYLQQLIMESLGKGLDRDNQEVKQGLFVFGNKGSTDQHAYVQQLREGLANFFAVFIEVLNDKPSASIDVEPRVKSGDYLIGFLLGTRDALFERGRESVLLSIGEVNAFAVGALIALFERAVGYYASMINVNAYHQPGVEAGKKAASIALDTQRDVMDFLSSKVGLLSVPEITMAIASEKADTVFRLCEHLAVNGRLKGEDVHEPAKARFGL
jgi:glucose-6-phosphate isomerase